MSLKIRLWSQSAGEDFERDVAEFVRSHGGTVHLLKRMELAGLGRVAESWIGNHAKEPITSEDLHRLFGTGALRAFAAKLDLPPREFVRRLTQELPRVVARQP